MNFLLLLFFIIVSFVTGYTVRGFNSRVDLLYSDISENFKKEVRKYGFAIHDISDSAHPNLIEVHYSKYQKNCYYSLLEKYNMSDRSPKYMKQRYKKS